MLILNWC